MSGICGAWSLDGGGSPIKEVEAMAAALERRGPDGTHLWHQGTIALGHCLLATTPEALVEVLPLTDRASGCTITADVRLDNRDELIAALELATESRTIGDGELILRAYLHWGEDCVDHLLGDFAFAIQDPRSKLLFCARDHMGMRQLIYHHLPDRHFLFATETQAVLAHGEVHKHINDGRIGDFLDNLEGLDLTSTFFEEVFRLPPAHCLTLGSAGLCLRRYWKLKAEPELKLHTDEDYSQAFLAVFTEAVRCRLRSAGPVTSMLSGGIDSNAVAAVASRLLAEDGRGPLLTFSATGPDPATCAESRAIQSAVTGADFVPVLIDHAAMDDLKDELVELTEQCAEPFDGHMTLLRSVYLAAHRRGAKVMLDGVSADVILSAGNRVADLLRQGRFRDAMTEASDQRRFWGAGSRATGIFMSAAWAVFAPQRVRRFRRKLIAHYHDRRARSGKGRMSIDFARKINLVARWNQFRQHVAGGVPVGAQHRAEVVGHPHLVVGRERYDRVASAVAIEPRDPFLDIRLIRHVLSLPASQLEAGGWPKIILRRAMHGLVPTDIVWRRGKTHLGWAFTLAVAKHWQCNKPESLRNQSLLERLLSPTALRTLDTLSSVNSIQCIDNQSQFELRLLSCWIARNR